jgi:hypothetical protein
MPASYPDPSHPAIYEISDGWGTADKETNLGDAQTSAQIRQRVVKTLMTSLSTSVPSMYHNAQASTEQTCKITIKAMYTPPETYNCRNACVLIHRGDFK